MFRTEDTSTVLAHVGDLTDLIDAAHEHASTVGRHYGQDRHVLSFIANVYDGGLDSFVLANNHALV